MEGNPPEGLLLSYEYDSNNTNNDTYEYSVGSTQDE